MKIFKHLKTDWFRYGFETIAVMVGILVAFALDNWNDQRKLDSVTHEYLENIKDDLIADTLALYDLIKFGEHRERIMGDYYKYYDSNDWTVQQLVDSCNNVSFRLFSFLPINNTYSDMLSSGNSSLLDDEIRMRLAKLKKEQDRLFIISEHFVRDIKTNVHELEKYWNIEESTFFKEAIENTRDLSSLKPDSWMPKDEKSLMLGLKYHHNIFSWTYKYVHVIKHYGADIRILSDEIIELIDAELEE